MSKKVLGGKSQFDQCIFLFAATMTIEMILT